MKTLKYAVRFLVRSRSYSLINLFGLAFSLACSIILLRYIHRELTVDTHCVDRERVVVPIRDIAGNRSINTTQFCDTTYIPDNRIIRRSYLSQQLENRMSYKGQDYFMNVILADSNFLQMFDYEALEGELELSAPHHALISEACAKRLFGNKAAVGKVLHYDWLHEVNNKRVTETISVTIGGVIKQPVCKTFLNFDILLSNQLEEYRGTMELMQLLPDVDLEAINKVSNVYRLFRANPNVEGFQNRWEFVTLKDLYFNRPNNLNHMEVFYNFGSSDYLGILFIVAMLLLFVGVMNFINLYMVYMMKRQKEYGIKKVYGLQKGPLFLQIWLENFLLAFWALMVAWLIIEITQVPVSQLMGVEMEYTPFDLYLSLGFLLLLPLLTSVYPYLRHQYMAPITSMRAIANSRQSVATRMMLLSVQYVVTFVLMVFSLYLNKHFRFLINTPPGFEYEQVIEAELIPESENFMSGNYREAYDKVIVLTEKLNECPDIEAWVSRKNILQSAIQVRFFNEKGESVIAILAEGSPAFFKVYGIGLVEGELPEYDLYKLSFIPNEATMKALGYTQMKDAFIRAERSLGIRQKEDGSLERYGASLFPVEAVMKDYYCGHLTQGIQPIVFRMESDGGVGSGKFYIRIQKGKEQAVIEYLKKAVMDVYGTDEISYSWMKDQVKAIYDEDRRVATIYTIFALIAIGVSCLGLFGISLFDIRQRYREIGIRKVNGAGMKDLYKLLFRKYVLILVASFAVAIPLAWYAIHIYTADFVVKAPVGIDVFLIALLLVALISMGTLWWQIRKAANINPSIVMKRE